MTFRSSESKQDVIASPHMTDYKIREVKRGETRNKGVTREGNGAGEKALVFIV